MTPKDIPAGEHWAILRRRDIHIPGDERSRTNPGHGYPASTERVIDYEVYLNYDEFAAALSSALIEPFVDVRGIHVTDEIFSLSTSIRTQKGTSHV